MHTPMEAKLKFMLYFISVILTLQFKHLNIFLICKEEKWRVEQKQISGFLHNKTYILVKDAVPKNASDKMCPTRFFEHMNTHSHTHKHTYLYVKCV